MNQHTGPQHLQSVIHAISYLHTYIHIIYYLCKIVSTYAFLLQKQVSMHGLLAPPPQSSILIP